MTEVQEFNDLLRKIKYDNDARQKFFCKYYSRLHIHGSLKYGNFSDWQDIVHDVVTKLIATDWSNYEYIECPTAWLFTVADNHAKDLFKQANRILEFNEYHYSDFNIEDVELSNDVKNAMKNLTRDEQYVLYAFYWLGKEQYIIAEEIGKTYGSVRTQIKRARDKLKNFL